MCVCVRPAMKPDYVYTHINMARFYHRPPTWARPKLFPEPAFFLTLSSFRREFSMWRFGFIT